MIDFSGKRPVETKVSRSDSEHRSQPVMSALVDRFEAMGLANFL